MVVGSGDSEEVEQTSSECLVRCCLTKAAKSLSYESFVVTGKTQGPSNLPSLTRVEIVGMTSLFLIDCSMKSETMKK